MRTPLTSPFRLFARLALFSVMLALVWPAHADLETDPFPGRPIYFHVPVIELDELRAGLDDGSLTAVDVRTRYEWDTLRIEDSQHVWLDDPEFVSKVKALHAERPATRIAFYCRGHSCFMSYQAVERMKAAGFDHSVSMDAGIFDWAETYPEKTALFGVAPLDTAELIDFNRFREHLLPPMEFSSRLQQENARALDLRRPFERDGISFFLDREVNISAEDTVAMVGFLREARESDKPLFVYDISGHEIKTFQYTLEAVGVKNYYFMEGGAKALIDEFSRL